MNAERFLFRAWDTDEKIMKFDSFIIKDGKFGYCDHDGDFWVDKDLILMQSTGLRDKNDKLIFEGDIVKSYIQGETEFKIDVIKDIREMYFLPSSHSFDNSWLVFEVIGNIYEHPNLLGEK